MASLVLSHVARGFYRDSVWLMRLAQDLLSRDGIEDVAIMMATDANKSVLRDTDLLGEGAEAAGPNDIILSVRADDAEAAKRAIDEALSSLERPISSGTTTHSTLGLAHAATPQANLALISVPGLYAAGVAQAAIAGGLNVMIFSDNVTVEDEVRLKNNAADRNLLVMGPDCGTAIINGIGVGFANAVRRGPVGIVGASGTGIQEISSLLDRCGIGVSQALGVGSHDISALVGGRSMLQAIDVLDSDPETEVIVLVSKPPARPVAKVIRDRSARCRKPVVLCLLADGNLATAPVPTSTLVECHRLDQVVPAVWQSLGLEWPAANARYWMSAAAFSASLEEQRARLRTDQAHLFAAYSGGTLRDEAVIVLEPVIGKIATNVDLETARILNHSIQHTSHVAIDVGADELTLGRPHPMIDPSLRSALIRAGARRAGTAVVLFDVVLGHGSHPDPAAAAAEAVREARSALRAEGRDVAFVASIVGVEADPQVFSRSRDLLITAGAAVLPSNAQAARFAAAILQSGDATSDEQFCDLPTAQIPPRKAHIGIWGGRTVVINVGLAHFNDALSAAGATTVQVDWRPAAGGDPQLAARLALIS